MNENVIKFFERYESEPELRDRVKLALDFYPGSLEIRESVVKNVLLPIAEAEGLAFTIDDLRKYETRKKLRKATMDNDEWLATIRHIAIEGHCYFINSDMYFKREDYPKDLHCPEEIAKLNETVCRGGSCIVDPYGHYVTEPVWDREEIIFAELDMQKVPASRMEFDACGHYSRPDVLKLSYPDE